MNRQVSLDYYERLGLPEFSTIKEIRRAFRSLALKWHPDRHKEMDKKLVEKKFKLISEAYSVLTKFKEEYDTLLRQMRNLVVVRYEFHIDGWSYAGTDNSTTGSTWF